MISLSEMVMYGWDDSATDWRYEMITMLTYGLCYDPQSVATTYELSTMNRLGFYLTALPPRIATQAFYKALRTPPYESYRG